MLCCRGVKGEDAPGKTCLEDMQDNSLDCPLPAPLGHHLQPIPDLRLGDRGGKEAGAVYEINSATDRGVRLRPGEL